MDDVDVGGLMAELAARLKPYDRLMEPFRRLPEEGLAEDKIVAMLEGFSETENRAWREGRVSGAVYHGGEELGRLFEKVFRLYLQANPLHPDVWPSLVKFEAEIVAMCASIMNGGDTVRGSVTSGGTESILLAMKTYRDYYRAKKNITSPEIVLPTSAHAAFLKACDYFSIRPVLVGLDDGFRVDVEKVRKAITPNTVAIVGSAPCFPYGVVDPIEELSQVALEHDVGLHVDACLGGFVLPWAEKLGHYRGRFDFRLPGVTSISMDTHKYGFAPKGTSVLLYRTGELFQHQVFATGTWCGGIYFTPTIAGSRPAYPIVAAWAVMLLLGQKGYMEAAKRILETGRYIRRAAENIEGLRVLGDPLWVIAMSSEKYDPLKIFGLMGSRGWVLNGLSNPPAFHIAVTMRHTYPGVKEKFVEDLKACVAEAANSGGPAPGLAPIYGAAAALPEEQVRFFLKNIVEWLYTVSPR